jgi:hypothetical protein
LKFLEIFGLEILVKIKDEGLVGPVPRAEEAEEAEEGSGRSGREGKGRGGKK